MPIYEYYCKACNTIYQFLMRGDRKEADLTCPGCSSRELERVMSTFTATVFRKKSDDELAADLADVDENDPRSMAKAVRQMADEMGEELGPELEHALNRLESGEDPEKIEQELEEMGLEGPGQASSSPARDPGLY
ncbi:hypothetical protein CSA37_06700 [Candidatus Fermentibacteria bacterium]|nr:MAG: hypothetical protein CSA37_06700 [Candidatus Fermentibacteria bacterium]